MKAVARLVLSYFICPPVLRIFSAVGAAIIVYSFLTLRFPAAAGAVQIHSQSDLGLAVAMLGVGMFFIGSALMPLMFGRMAGSHLFRVLPWGRVRLLASAFVVNLVVALPLPVLTFALMDTVDLTTVSRQVQANVIKGIHETFWLTFTSTFLTSSWLYLAMWFVTSQRSIAGYVKGLLVVLFLIVVPGRQVQELSVTMRGSLTEIGGTWLIFGAGFLLWPRLKALGAGLRFSPAASIAARLGRQVSGREIDMLLGTANPWLLAVAQLAPILIASTIGFYSAAVWLFYLTIFSTVAGAIAGQAAERSRALWLRGNWSRGELFSQVERSFWRHNGIVLGVLIAMMLGIGSYAGLPVSLLAAGLPLLALGTVISTYLGLMITRGLRVLEATLAIAAMLSLMAIAVAAARSGGAREDLVTVTALEALLAAVALIFRAVAKSRWSRLDWTLCRPDRALNLRTAS
ncbi:MAG: hypothetical protein WDO56_17570 [Gammaproteobacteria bacterium]